MIMFYENIGVPVRSSTKYLAIFGLLLLVVGMGYSVYLYHKASTPSVPERAMRSGQQQQTCPSSSKTDVNRCLITKVGVMVETEQSVNPAEFKFCWVRPEGSLIESKWLGLDLLQIKSGGDDFQIEYKWVKKFALVDGKCPNKF